MFGAIAIFENIFVFLATKREKILKLRCLSDLLWIASFLCLGGYTAAVLNAVDAVATVVFCYREKCKRLDHAAVPLVFVLLSLSSPIAEWISGGFSLRPVLCVAGSTLMLIALWQKKPNFTRYIAMASDVLWLVYSLMVPSISGAVCNAVLILSTGIGILRSYLKASNESRPSESAGGAAEIDVSPDAASRPRPTEPEKGDSASGNETSIAEDTRGGHL